MSERLTQIQNFYASAFAQFDKKRAAPPIAVEFYNYVGLRHTIRIRDGKVFVRLSDLTKDAPEIVHRALALILVAKLLRRKIPAQANQIYRGYTVEPNTVEKSNNKRRADGRKIVTSEAGKVYDLKQLFALVNQTYFGDAMRAPILTWSTQKTFRIFGHHDALHDTIVISQTLDDARVPQFVVEFVLYHELLHIKHPTSVVNGRRQIHTRAFKLDEQKFARFDEAEKWLEKLARQQRKVESRS